MTRQQRRSQNKGFTLLEVMVALTIVSITLIAVLGLTQRNILINEKLQQMTRATFLAKQKMAEIENSVQQSMDQNQGVFIEPNQDFRWRAVYTPTQISGIEQIDLSVLWGEEKKNELVTLTSFMLETP
jgi:general secretion pathway protein I